MCHSTAYHWLEEDRSAKAQSWLAMQSERTSSYLAGLPIAQIRQRLDELADSMPLEACDPQDELVGRQLAKLSERIALPRSTRTSTDDRPTALVGWAASADGRWLAYASADPGSDAITWRIRDLIADTDLPDCVRAERSSTVVWDQAGQGFFCTLIDAAAGWTIAYHRLGTPQADDRVVYRHPTHPEWRLIPDLSEDGRYLNITVVQGSDIRNLVLVQDLMAEQAPVIALVSTFDAIYEVVGNAGPLFWMRVEDLLTPRGRVVAVDLRNPSRMRWREIIPQTSATLQRVQVLNNQFVALYLQDTCSAVAIHALDGTLVRHVDLPGRGVVAGFEGRRDDTKTSYTFSNIITPPAAFRYDLRAGTSSLAAQTASEGESTTPYNPAEYETQQVFYSGRDGTLIPMWISHKRGLVLDGSNPTYLTAYGGFNVALAPAFASENLAWLELGGIYAVAHVRGGGEYGRAWHQAAIRRCKQTSFDDCIAAAEWLIARCYTSPARLAIGGQSNGGLTAAACLTQRPELFGAAVLHSAVLDMLRFDRLGMGRDWRCEYGSPADPLDLAALVGYSPLHNIRPGTRYPPSLIITSQCDEIVGAAHSRMFAAALQDAQAGAAPLLLWVNRPAGHGMSSDDAAVVWAFLAHTFGMA
jgi:prolyl oligopeptidase